jgi:hypothetical protein
MTSGVGYIRGRSQRASYWRTTWGKPHQFDSRSHQHSQASHPDFEPTYARSPAPGVYSSSLRPHRATRDERARAQGRVVRGSPRTRRDRADRAGSFLGPGSGADDGHDRPSSRSGWADRRPIIRSRVAPRQHSRQPPLPSDRPSSRIAAARRRASLFCGLPASRPRLAAAAPLPTGLGAPTERPVEPGQRVRSCAFCLLRNVPERAGAFTSNQ